MKQMTLDGKILEVEDSVPFDISLLEPDELFYYYVDTFEELLNVSSLRHEGKITRFRYRWDKSTGGYVVRFRPTEKFDPFDFFNYSDYYPDRYEARRKWYKSL
jgi:hypothetical protein